MAGGDLPGRGRVVVGADGELLKTALTATGAVALIFIGGWENGRRPWSRGSDSGAAEYSAATEAGPP